MRRGSMEPKVSLTVTTRARAVVVMLSFGMGIVEAAQAQPAPTPPPAAPPAKSVMDSKAAEATAKDGKAHNAKAEEVAGYLKTSGATAAVSASALKNAGYPIKDLAAV